ncbi:MAG: FAD-dependent oxidoreductase, partial [Planctomycetales bacterium]
MGGGPAATNALETIREIDGGESRITLICDEPAHSRMALPYWLAGNIQREHVMTADPAYFREKKVDARIGVRATNIDPQAKKITLSDGGSLDYDDLLIATGSSPAAPPIPGADSPGVQPLWTIAQTQSVVENYAGAASPRVVMIGAGFIGFIMMNAMFKRGWRLSVVEQESRVLPRMLDEGAAGMVASWLAAKDVAVHAGTTAKEIRSNDSGTKTVALADGTEIEADLVVIATGIRTNLQVVDGSGIETDQGVLVNDRMQTNFPDVYAGGDVAQGPVLGSDAKAIHAIQPTAVDHGRVAGANMAGQETHYPGSLLMNVVDVCGLQSASFGNWAEGEAVTISSPEGHVYRKLMWTGDQITGAIFTGRANDLGMLNDVGMIKGILQTQTPMGPWKEFLKENPFDVRR